MSAATAIPVKSSRTRALEALRSGTPGDAGFYVNYPSDPKRGCIWKLVGPFPTQLEAAAFSVLVHPERPASACMSGVYEYTAEELEHGVENAKAIGFSALRLLDLMDAKTTNVPCSGWGLEHGRMGVTVGLVGQCLAAAGKAAMQNGEVATVQLQVA
jgi:hypothetical protein